ncbi:MAG: methyl-accepting chemotaxis protein [Oscillospiraceae bacterium]|nr:methyl-accepting chemotaxis protein [Oscillospiraceae bacterium]
MNIKKMILAVRVMVPATLILLGVLFFVLVSLISETSRLREECAQILECGNTLQHSNDKAVKLARQFSFSLNESILGEYSAALNKIDADISRMGEFNLSNSEQQTWNSIVALLDKLAAMEDTAFGLYRGGDADAMVEIIQGDEYYGNDVELAAKINAYLGDISERYNNEVETAVNRGVTFIAVFFFFVFLSLLVFFPVTNSIIKKLFWHENILDNIPFPLSITNNKREWTFINKPVEQFLGKKRNDVIGMQCYNWGAGICKTPQCGVECLARGETHSSFSQQGMDFRVDVAYLSDAKGNRVGHIEVVQDISHSVSAKRRDDELIKNATILSEQFAKTSQEIANSSQAIAQGSTEQAVAVGELSSTIQEIESKTKANAEMADSAAKLSSDIKSKAEKGSRQMDELMSAVQDINEASGQIEKVIKVIDDIAFQTNILALNAAVEAARAGSAGKGFAVVAEEVRNLASKSAEAASNTGELIEDSISKSNLGMSLATETTRSLKEIVDGINHNAEIISQIAQSSEEQAVSIRGIKSGVEQVADVVQQNSATSEQSAAASAEMSREVLHLESLLVNFKSE